MRHVQLGIAPAKVAQAIARAEGFLDVLATYADEQRKYYKVVLVERPTSNVIRWLKRKIQKWDYTVYLQLEYPTGSQTLSIGQAKDWK